VLIVSGFACLEKRLKREQRAKLASWSPPDGPEHERLRALIDASGMTAHGWSVETAADERCIGCEVRWRALPSDVSPPAVVGELERLPGVTAL
jgi:hypothetical protein